MNDTQLDRLDALAQRVIETGNTDALGVLSTGELLYVALAANRMDLKPDYNIAAALARMDDGDVDELIRRWRYK